MRVFKVALLALVACTGRPDTDTVPVETADTVVVTSRPLLVTVTLDGSPIAGAMVSQGGREERWTTGPDGTASIELDLTVDGEIMAIASHPDARTQAAYGGDDAAVTIELARFDRTDNPAFSFGHPGTPDLRDTTEYCAHCHASINADWYASPHRTSASNPVVRDVYADVVGALASTATPYGACADCHAPGIDGARGGRDLAEATGVASDYGVHCDVCHHVESVDPASPAGVAGRLHLVRPVEPAPNPSLGDFLPLTFGPYDDVPVIVMGGVARELFHDGSLCLGCHEYEQTALPDGAAIDLARWPSGRIPVHSTYSEWQASTFGASGVACPACHMPPDPSVGNSADLGHDSLVPGLATGWFRPPGAVRRHTWYGPRQPASGMLRLAAAVDVAKEVVASELVATVTVRNVGCGHALPTGEPLRSVVLRVEARCGDVPLVATGGDAVPDVGGALDRKLDGEDWSRWTGASVGDVIRVIDVDSWRDYAGPGPFGDGTFDATAKGMPAERVLGEAVVIAVSGDVVTLDRALPGGDVAYRGDAIAVAGAPGFAFARVLAASDGRRQVPHWEAVDVVSDNRLLPGGSFTTTHRFAATCADPTVTATLVHRGLPPDVARARGLDVREEPMVTVTR